MTLGIQIDRKAYAETPDRAVLEDIRIDMAAGEFIAVVGPSGCGKSTLLHIVAGLDKDFTGRIDWPRSRAAFTGRLGYVFQTPRLLPWLRVRDNIALVLPHPAAAEDRIDDLLEAMGLRDFADYFPNRLSVGMQRRVALARAFAVEPEILLMDEPFVSLDLPTTRQLHLLLLKVWDRYRSRVLFVTHDLLEAILLADRVLFLSRSPARIIGEAEVEIARDRRTDESALYAHYQAIKRQFDRLYDN